MIDYWRVAKGFEIGDWVQKFVPGMSALSLSPFTGIVQAVHAGIGYLDVSFPQGMERLSADEVVKVNPALATFLPVELAPPTTGHNLFWKNKAASNKSLWANTKLPKGFYIELAKSFSKKASEVESYDHLWHSFSKQASDAQIKQEVAKFYRVAAKLTDFRISQHVHKTAAYWFAQNRQYRITADEITAKRPNCPKCGSTMRRTTYKMDKGARVRLFACPKDLFLLKSDSILGPGGEPLGW